VRDYSVAEDLARSGFLVFVMDVRGWGSSTRPPEMDQPLDHSAPLVSTKEAADDIATVVEWIAHRTHHKVAVMGWASGGHWACAYASREPSDLSQLILLNSLYAVNASWELRSALHDKNDPQRFDSHAGGYRLADRNALLRRWDTSIPSTDKSVWREPAVAEAYSRLTLESDPTSSRRNPPSVRIPIGYLRDAFDLSVGTSLFDAARIRVPDAHRSWRIGFLVTPSRSRGASPRSRQCSKRTHRHHPWRHALCFPGSSQPWQSPVRIRANHFSETAAAWGAVTGRIESSRFLIYRSSNGVWALKCRWG
jgi:pimeloyl-ACP methyl ester carboxylesterase